MQTTDPLFLKACRCQHTDRIPVWFMRQAGRYMKPYRDIKSKFTFEQMCKKVDLATEITLLPISMLAVDAAILFSDILWLAEAMGGKLSFVQGHGPRFDNPIEDVKHVENFSIDGIYDKMSFVFENIKSVKKQLPDTIPLIGFAGAPFTLLAYLIEGGSTNNFKKTKCFLYQYPLQAHRLLDKICQATIIYLKGQIEAGVDALQLFDTWSSVLAWGDFQSYSHKYNKQIMEALHFLDIPLILFSKSASVFYPLMLDSKVSVISFDSSISLNIVKENIPKNIAIQGNLDPDILFCQPKEIKSVLKKNLLGIATRPGYIFNLGHGILPQTPLYNVQFVVDFIKNYSLKHAVSIS